MGICLSCSREPKLPEKRHRPGRARAKADSHLPVLAAMANSISNIKMTNPIKGFVSKRRKRYIQDGFNLDLAYITDRLIAMGFPAEKLEGVYRNHIDEVYRFLEQKHRDRYRIYNLCAERTYDPAKFHDRVVRYAFEDHSPPKMELIQPFCEDVHTWLSINPNNVAAVHCKAGKGRTGTMVCCYLLYSGQKTSADDALNYYGTTRTHDKKGVTIPSQRRYVEYYAALLQRGLRYCGAKVHVREVLLHPPPFLNGGQATLELCISQAHPPLKAPSHCYEVRKHDSSVRMSLNQCTPLCGDVKVEVFTKPKMMRREKLFHFWFNTFFVTQGVGARAHPPLHDSYLETFRLTLNKFQLDDAHKDKQHKLYPADFTVEVIIQKQPDSSKFSGHTSADRSEAPSPPSSSDSSCSDPDDEADENWESGEPTTPLADYPAPYSLYTYPHDDDSSTHSSTMTSITDLTEEKAEGKIPKVSSAHTISDCERHLLKSPTDASKKKYLFFKKDEEKKCADEREPRPRLSLGDMRASWREFSGKHFGTEHGKPKKRNEQDGG